MKIDSIYTLGQRATWRHLALAALVATASAGLTSCDDNAIDRIVTSQYFTVDQPITSVSGEGGQIKINITANCNWVITGNPGWVKPDIASGNGNATVTLTCEENPSSTDTRDASLRVKTSDDEVIRTINIHQLASSEKITVDPSSVSFDAAGGTMVVHIETNSKWRVSGMQEWVVVSTINGEEISEGNGSMDVKIEASLNTVNSPRSTTLLFSNDTRSAQVNVTQEGRTKVIDISPEVVEMSSAGGTFDIVVNATEEWTASIRDSWVSMPVDKNKGSGLTQIRLTIDPNTSTTQRETIITFTSKSGSNFCTIRQTAADVPEIFGTTVEAKGKSILFASASYYSGNDVIECGFFYAEGDTEPGTSSPRVVSQNADGTKFSVEITGLKPATLYSVRPYVRTVVGMFFGNTVTVTTPGGVSPEPGDNPAPGM